MFAVSACRGICCDDTVVGQGLAVAAIAMAAAESKIFFIREINRLLIKFSDTQLWYSKQTIETYNAEKVPVSIIYFSSLFYKHKISKYFLIHQIITKLF